MHQAAHPSARAFKSRSARCSWRHAGHTIPDSEPTVAAQCLPRPRIPCCIVMCSTTKVRFAADTSGPSPSARARAAEARRQPARARAGRWCWGGVRGSRSWDSGEGRPEVCGDRKSRRLLSARPGVSTLGARSLVARDPAALYPDTGHGRGGAAGGMAAIARTRARDHMGVVPSACARRRGGGASAADLCSRACAHTTTQRSTDAAAAVRASSSASLSCVQSPVARRRHTWDKGTRLRWRRVAVRGSRRRRRRTHQWLLADGKVAAFRRCYRPCPCRAWQGRSLRTP